MLQRRWSPSLERWRPRPDALLDMKDPAVRQYVASLLVDPNFAALVRDVGDVSTAGVHGEEAL